MEKEETNLTPSGATASSPAGKKRSIIIGPFIHIENRAGFERAAFYVDDRDIIRVPKNPVWLEKSRIKQIWKHDADETFRECYFVEYESDKIVFYKNYDLEPGLFEVIKKRKVELPAPIRGQMGYCHGCGRWTQLVIFEYFDDAENELGFCSEECYREVERTNISAIFGVMD